MNWGACRFLTPRFYRVVWPKGRLDSLLCSCLPFYERGGHFDSLQFALHVKPLELGVILCVLFGSRNEISFSRFCASGQFTAVSSSVSLQMTKFYLFVLFITFGSISFCAPCAFYQSRKNYSV